MRGILSGQPEIRVNPEPVPVPMLAPEDHEAIRENFRVIMAAAKAEQRNGPAKSTGFARRAWPR